MGKIKRSYSSVEVNSQASSNRAYTKRPKQLEQQEVMPNIWLKHQDAYLSHLETALRSQLVQPKDAVLFWSHFTTGLCEACRVSKDTKTFREAQDYYKYLRTLDNQFENTFQPTVFEPEFKIKLREILQIFPVFFPNSQCSSTGLLTAMTLPGSIEHSLNRSDLDSQLEAFIQTLINDKTISLKKAAQVLSEFESMEARQRRLILGMPLELKIKEVKKIARRTHKKTP